MNIVAIIQARMGSTRLPGKVLKDLGGKTVLEQVIHRVRRSRLISHIVIASTTQPSDDPITKKCQQLNVVAFRGNEDDVLDRYLQAARNARADAIVRITSDCPLIDPEITDRTVQAFLDQKPDYASNTLERTYPRGLDTEVMTMHALERAAHEASQPYQRTHVTPYLYQNSDRFRLLSVKANTDFSHYRWTLDTPEDLEFLRAVYARFAGAPDFGWWDVISLMEREPALAEVNRHIAQKALHEG